MIEVFVKKYWDEEDVLFYIHFQDDEAVRQIEVKSEEKICLTLEEPIKEESMLYDQKLSELDLEESDFITEEEFNQFWKKA
ncbi:hypothetical protein C8C83_4584 [Flavobacterium sp. 90]|uniref:hypothetical protein n=1 Tax=unclassified Flavobacterium TaxID=196869 RepID=UPI000EB35A19|nr:MULTISPECIES: hypothetical protein [unclassified Flavobacterium]RKR05245.1 hypothetical protein C8C82_4926 [Flavobacterium sp. 81]TCK56560.1 hypothetical protein C8C83_4584 [Flavobacterium sp. 90]